MDFLVTCLFLVIPQTHMWVDWNSQCIVFLIQSKSIFPWPTILLQAGSLAILPACHGFEPYLSSSPSFVLHSTPSMYTNVNCFELKFRNIPADNDINKIERLLCEISFYCLSVNILLFLLKTGSVTEDIMESFRQFDLLFSNPDAIFFKTQWTNSLESASLHNSHVNKSQLYSFWNQKINEITQNSCCSFQKT